MNGATEVLLFVLSGQCQQTGLFKFRLAVLTAGLLMQCGVGFTVLQKEGKQVTPVQLNWLERVRREFNTVSYHETFVLFEKY